MEPNMSSKKLDTLVEEIKRQYEEAKTQEAEESIFGSISLLNVMQTYDRVIQTINKIYQTKYKLNQEEKHLKAR